MEMIKNSPKDCYSTVQKTIMVVLERLQQVRNQDVVISCWAGARALWPAYFKNCLFLPS